jgi:deoxyribodipyrimidine photolyase-related protein
VNRYNTGNFSGEVERAVKELKCKRLIVTEPGEYRVLESMKVWQTALGIPVEIFPTHAF